MLCIRYDNSIPFEQHQNIWQSCRWLTLLEQLRPSAPLGTPQGLTVNTRQTPCLCTLPTHKLYCILGAMLLFCPANYSEYSLLRIHIFCLYLFYMHICTTSSTLSAGSWGYRRVCPTSLNVLCFWLCPLGNAVGSVSGVSGIEHPHASCLFLALAVPELGLHRWQ